MNAFHDQIEMCVPALRRYARALTRDRNLADDLVHDCVERALRKHHLWSERGDLKSWLFAILANIYRNDLRRARNLNILVALEEVATKPSSPPEQPAKIELSETLAALNRLPDEQREALLLVVLEGFSYADAAGILDIPVGTLVSRIGRARSKLRQITEGSTPATLRRVK